MLLEVARQTVQQVRAVGTPAPANGAGSPLLVTQGELVRGSMGRLHGKASRWQQRAKHLAGLCGSLCVCNPLCLHPLPAPLQTCTTLSSRQN